MKDLVETIVALESRLLGTWTRRPGLRAAWTPDPEEHFTIQAQALAAACRSVSDLTERDLGVHAVAALAQAGKLSLWTPGAMVFDHLDDPDPIRSLDRLRELQSICKLHKRLTNALAGVGGTSDLSELRGLILEALAASQLASSAMAYSDEQLMGLALATATTRHIAGTATGFAHLDDVTGGLRNGHVWVVGAPTNWGKSSLLLAILDHCLGVGRKALIVTCEDAPELLGTRLLARRARLPGKGTRDGQLTRSQLEQASEQVAAARARGPAPVLLDGRGLDVERIAGDIRAAVRAHAVSVVMVDYLQCVNTGRATQDRRSEINHIARTLTDVIKTTGAAGILASQLTGEDIRESRDVEHGAEVVLIGRKTDAGMCLFVKKNKTGPKDIQIDLVWDDLNGSFRTDIGDALAGEWDMPSDPRPEEWDNYRA